MDAYQVGPGVPDPQSENRSDVPAVASEPAGNPRQAIILLSAGILLIGGAVFAAYKGWFSVPFLFQPPSLEDVAANMENIRSARLGVELDVSIGERDASVRPISLFDLMGKKPGDTEAEKSIGSFMGALALVPDEIDMNLSGTSDWDRSAGRVFGESVFGGSFGMPGMSAEFEAEIRAVDKDVFVRVNEAPPIIPFVGGIQGKWIRTGGDDGSGDQVGVFRYKTELDGEEPAKETDIAGEMTVLLTEMIRGGALSVEGKPARSEDPLGRKAYRYELALDSAKAVEALRSATERRAELLPNSEDFVILADEGTSKASFAYEGAFYDVISKNLEQALYADRKTGMPLALTADFVIAFDAREAPDIADRQIAVSLTLTFDRVNEPIAVEAPDEFVTRDEAALLMNGRGADDQKMRDQIGNIGDIRDALRIFREKNGAYPPDLGELLGIEDRPDFIADTGDIESLIRVVAAIPDDLYTGKPLEYGLTDDGDYQLVYRLEIPEVSTYVDRYDYADGINTATPETASVEGGADDGEAETAVSEIPSPDTDGDGLSDAMETDFYGTDPYLADTDGDGYDDGAEVAGGYDPLTNAQTGEGVAR